MPQPSRIEKGSTSSCSVSELALTPQQQKSSNKISKKIFKKRSSQPLFKESESLDGKPPTTSQRYTHMATYHHVHIFCLGSAIFAFKLRGRFLFVVAFVRQCIFVTCAEPRCQLIGTEGLGKFLLGTSNLYEIYLYTAGVTSVETMRLLTDILANRKYTDKVLEKFGSLINVFNKVITRYLMRRLPAEVNNVYVEMRFPKNKRRRKAYLFSTLLLEQKVHRNIMALLVLLLFFASSPPCTDWPLFVGSQKYSLGSNNGSQLGRSLLLWISIDVQVSYCFLSASWSW